MGDSGFPVALQWDLGPEKLRQIKYKLLSYFGSLKKSNGGECVMEDTDCTKGHVLIHFTQETVRDRVLRKQKHILNLSPENTINLIVTLPEAASSETTAKGLSSEHEAQESGKPKEKRILLDPGLLPPPTVSTLASDNEDKKLADPPSSLVLIENIQNPCTLDVLNLLLENVTGKEMIQDFQVEMVPENRVAVVTFTCNIDLPGFIEEFRGHPRARKLDLAAKLTEETRSVRVEGLPPNTSEDFIILYFESPKHGGGSVTDTLLVPEESAAIVTFQDEGVTRTVLAMKHVLGRTEISVYPYYASLGITLYGNSGPPVTKPDPLEFPVSPYILEFIRNDAQGKPNIEEKMATVHCDITWPDVNCPNPVMKLCLASKVSTHARTLVKIVPTWRENVSAEYKLLISKYKVAEFPVSEAVWEAVRRHVGSSTYARVLLKPNLAKEKLFLAGFVKDVTQTEPVLGKLIEDTRRRVHRETHSVTDELALAPALYEIMSRNGLERNVRILLPQLNMSYDGSRRKLLLCGLREEISESKCKVMEMERSLKHASISPDPHIVRFLKVTSSDEMSCALFIRANINAMFQVEGDAIKLTGFSTSDLSEAEKIIKQELLCKKVTVTDKSLLKSTEWQSLDGSLRGGFNAETCRFLMEESPSGEEHQVVISGFSIDVKRVYEKINGFIQENTQVTEDIRVQSMAVAHFLRDENKSLWGNLEKMKVKFVIDQRKISLNGTKSSVLEAAGLIERVLSSLYTDTLRIDKPGAKSFCKDNEDVYVTSAKTKFHCALYLLKDGESNFAGSPYEMAVSGGVTVAVYKGDLSQHGVDAAIIAVNRNLEPLGQLAPALFKAAGLRLQANCDKIIKEKGKLLVGDSVITSAGNLPYRHVIHAVTPVWNRSPHCQLLLQKVISQGLELAAERGHRSVAIPVVTRVPVEDCVKIIMKSVHDYVGKHSSGSIDRIHLVDINDRVINDLIKALKGEPKSQDKSSKGKTKCNDANSPKGKGGTTEGKMVTTNEGLTIKLMQGNIQDTATDIIVNSVGKDLDLSSGAASKALLEKASMSLQAALDKLRQGSQGMDGAMYITDGGKLYCKEVYHTVVPQWDGQTNSSEKMLKQILNTCLITAETRRMKSISFPAIGTGNLGFPKSNVAAIMFDEILSLSRAGRFQHLKEVHVVLHPSDTECIKEFFSELNKRTDASAPAGSARGAGAFGAVYGAVTSPTPGVHKMKLNSIIYQVKTGDLTKEDTDVIVNSSNGTFNLNAGVSKAILDAAGTGVVTECAQLASKPNSGFIRTQSGNLKCKSILHVHVGNSAALVKKAVRDVLQVCEGQRYTSVAFPALGTGAGSLTSADAANAMLDALVEFANSPSVRYVREVKVVIFQQHMISDFCSSMTKAAGSGQPKPTSFFSRITTAVLNLVTSTKEKAPQRFLELKDNTESVIFHLCGESKESVKKTSAWLQDLIMKEQSENSIKNDWIKDFGDQELDKLRDLQKRLRVNMSFNPRESNIMVSGLTRDVQQVSTEIQTLINDLREKKNREREAELCSNLVEWRYRDGSRSKQFDIMTNLELENAKKENRQSFSISIEGTTYTVNMETKSASDSKGNSVKLERILKNEQSACPSHWDPNDDNMVKVIALSPGSQEYNDIKGQFERTCRMRIIKIERIQNQPLWSSYQIKKKSIDTKNGNTNNEKQLFHGTDFQTISHVNTHGFNRSYAGKNAAYYGNGTYFAVNAIYSANDTYTPPDSMNYKYMYLARVITGVFCAGTQGMVTPPPKNPSNPTDLHNSVTDNVANPSMYVIFNDIQAYPEYLITFCKM